MNRQTISPDKWAEEMQQVPFQPSSDGHCNCRRCEQRNEREEGHARLFGGHARCRCNDCTESTNG